MATQARNTYALVDAIIALNRANGVDVDLDVAVFLADQRPSASLLATTRKASAKRPGVVGHDALDWVMHRLGMKREAAAEIAKNEKHVILAYAAMWLVAAGFVLFLWRRQQALKIEIANLRRDLATAAK